MFNVRGRELRLSALFGSRRYARLVKSGVRKEKLLTLDFLGSNGIFAKASHTLLQKVIADEFEF